MIEVRSIQKVFGKEIVALKKIDLQIHTGEFVALLGPSGCGKSTTLNVISGLLEPTSGSVFFNNKDVTHLSPKERNIGMVFQSYALYTHLKVIDNIAFPLKQKGVSKKERHARATDIAKKIKIDYLLQRKPSQLSGGQQQRVAMARALVKSPDILLFDEPMSNLDARLKIEIREEIKRIQKELGITAIIVTHDQEEAMAIADKIAILDNGQIQQYGSPNELYYNPKNLFVAQFMGTPPMNFLTGVIKKQRDLYSLIGDGYEYVFSREYSQKLSKTEKCSENKKIVFGIRPHQIEISKKNPSTMKFCIQIMEDLGREIIFTGMLGGEKIRVLVDKVELQRSDSFYTIGANNQNIFLSFQDKFVIFDQETGENILL